MTKELNILIYAKPEKVEHKMADKVHPDTCHCFWTGRCPVKNKLDKICNVYFSDGNHIYAKGYFFYAMSLLNKQISFSPLERVNLKQPQKPPTRGWCY